MTKISEPMNEQQFENFWIPESNSGCWLWIGGYSNGYGTLKKKGAHRISWEIYRGKIPTGMSILHKCDTKGCVNPDHLFLGTQLDNVLDCHRKGRFPKAKLSDMDVIEIRKSNLSQSKIAKQFGVHQTMIHYIKTKKTWKHV